MSSILYMNADLEVVNGKVFCIGSIKRSFKSKDLKLDIEKVWIHYTLEDYLNQVSLEKTKDNKQKYPHCIVSFTNASRYDSEFFKKMLQKHKYVQTFNRKNMTIKGKYYNILETKNGILNLTFSWNGTIFQIRDFKRLVGLSVEDKGKIIGIQKGAELENYTGKLFYEKNGKIITDFEAINKAYLEKTITKQELDIFVHYCKKDVLIDALYQQKHEATVGKTKKLTHSALAFDDCKKYVKNKKEISKKVMLNIENTNVWTLHYKGGINYYNPLYIFKMQRDVQSFDVNAMYPALMTQPIPYTSGLDVNKENEVNIAKIKEKAAHSTKLIRIYLSSFSKKEIWYPTYYFKNGINELWEKELEFLNKYYKLDYYVLSEKFFPLASWAKELQEDKYKERMVYKARKALNPEDIEAVILEKDVKTGANSIYGKFGEDPNRISYLETDIEYKIGDVHSVNGEKEPYQITGICNVQKNGIFRYKVESIKPLEERANIYIASYITMSGRTLIYPYIESGKVICADTDGFKATSDFVMNPDDIDPNALGKFKNEGTYKYFVALGYKSYMFGENEWINDATFKWKGVQRINLPEKLSMNNPKNFLKIEAHCKKRIKTAEGFLIKDTPIELKEIKKLYNEWIGE